MFDSHNIDDNFTIPSAIRSSTGGALQPSDTGGGTVFRDAEEIDLDAYDHIILLMSGGKDSIASAIRLEQAGVDMRKVEFWHHDIDGREGSSLMDWMFMADYNRKLAAEFNVPLYFSWLKGGFEGEMLKQDAISQPDMVETPGGLITLERNLKLSKKNTRLKFPQQSASLAQRWCSSKLKIDVGRRAVNSQSRFHGKKVLVISGERRQESANRSKYNQYESHATNATKSKLNRLVNVWRPVLNWSEEDVWAALESRRITAPVPYRLGWTRSSCMKCIYNSPRVWATIRRHFPGEAEQIADYEEKFGVTISRKRLNVIDISDGIEPFNIDDAEALRQAVNQQYTLPVTTSDWKLPLGAFGSEGCGSV